jgi:hypothetical protein
MQSARLLRRRVSWSMRVSSSSHHAADSRAQSSRSGVRSSGSVANASLTIRKGMPTRWATRITATRRSVSRG